jgi:hypothetical protein
MKKNYSSIAAAVLLCATVCAARNPFEFADQELKKYTTSKVVPARRPHSPKEQKRSPQWEIVEIKDNATHVIKDNKGNVREISLVGEK